MIVHKERAIVHHFPAHATRQPRQNTRTIVPPCHRNGRWCHCWHRYGVCGPRQRRINATVLQHGGHDCFSNTACIVTLAVVAAHQTARVVPCVCSALYRRARPSVASNVSPCCSRAATRDGCVARKVGGRTGIDSLAGRCRRLRWQHCEVHQPIFAQRRKGGSVLCFAHQVAFAQRELGHNVMA